MNFNIDSETFNLNKVIEYAFNNEVDFYEYFDALGFEELLTENDVFELRNKLALKELGSDVDDLDEDELEETLDDVFNDGVLQINRIDMDSNLFNGLVKWFGSFDNVFKKVRSAVRYGDALYYVTGLGYDVVMTDLLNLRLGDNINYWNTFNNVISDEKLTGEEKKALQEARK